MVLRYVKRGDIILPEDHNAVRQALIDLFDTVKAKAEGAPEVQAECDKIKWKAMMLRTVEKDDYVFAFEHNTKRDLLLNDIPALWDLISQYLPEFGIKRAKLVEKASLIEERKYGDLVFAKDHNNIVSALELARSQAEQVRIYEVLFTPTAQTTGARVVGGQDSLLASKLFKRGAVTARKGEITTPTIKWSYGISAPYQTPPAVRDIDNDGIIEVVTGEAWKRVWCFRGPDGSLKWVYWADKAVRHVTVFDIDHDGKDEIIFPDYGGYWHCLNPDGTLRWKFTPDVLGPGTYYYGCSCYDVDGDGELEIIAHASGNGVGYVYLLRSDGTIKVSSGPIEPSAITYAIEDVDGDGELEIIGVIGRTVALFRPDLTIKVQSPDLGAGPLCPTPYDVDGDGVIEVVAVAGAVYAIYALNPDLTVKWKWVGPTYTYALPLGVHDVDGDGLAEIYFTLEYRELMCLKGDGTVLWEKYNTEHRPACGLCDIDGDGMLEVLYSNFRPCNVLIALNALTGETKWAITVGESHVSNPPVCEDVDNDGKAEVLLNDWFGAKIFCIEQA